MVRALQIRRICEMQTGGEKGLEEERSQVKKNTNGGAGANLHVADNDFASNVVISYLIPSIFLHNLMGFFSWSIRFIFIISILIK